MPTSKPTFHPAGFTIAELLLSSVVGSMILLGICSLMSSGSKNYKASSSSHKESNRLRALKEIIEIDLQRIITSLPLSVRNGTGNIGYHFVKGHVLPLADSPPLRALHLKESASTLPSDQLGFFIKEAPSLGHPSPQKNIAHVLYFTALTQDHQGEFLHYPSTNEDSGFSRKLYRLYTTPEEVYKRLNNIQKVNNLSEVPRQELSYSNDSTKNTLSIIANDIAQFQVELSALYSDQTAPQNNRLISPLPTDHTSLKAVAQTPETPRIHDLLSSPSTLGVLHLTPKVFSFQVKSCPPHQARTLSVEDWKTATGTEVSFIGRAHIPLKSFSFSHELLLSE